MRFVVCICFFIALTSCAWASDDVILLGMVEDVPGVYYGDSNSTRVRVLFSHQGNQWQAFQSDCENSGCLSAITKSFPKEVVWYIGLDGCQIGKVTARTPNNFSFYAHIGLQDIFEGRAPVVGKSSYEFAGFGGRPVRRPLVAVSKQYFSDPQGWKRHKPTPKLIMQTLKIMRKSAPAVCKEGQSEKQQLIPFHYTQDDLEIRAHKSINGSVLLTVSMNDVFYCEGGDGDGGYDAQTFAISPTGKTYYLGPGLILVDAGDYNGDGSSELVMALSLYNRGGYVLFSNSFIEEARFEFGYH